MGGESEKKHYLNLEGEVCPMNFVRIKLKLEQIAGGEVLEARINKESCSNVVRSIKEDGYNILYVQKQDDSYIIMVRK